MRLINSWLREPYPYAITLIWQKMNDPHLFYHLIYEHGNITTIYKDFEVTRHSSPDNYDFLIIEFKTDAVIANIRKRYHHPIPVSNDFKIKQVKSGKCIVVGLNYDP